MVNQRKKADKHEAGWLWDEPFGNPDAEDIGPELTQQQITAWENEHGVVLPAILRRAYLQQNGGYLKNAVRPAALVQLANIGEWQVEDLQIFRPWGVPHASNDGRFDRGRLFDIGWDDVGAHLLLHYVHKGKEPLLYFYYGDGGSFDGDGIAAERLWEEG